MKLITSHISDTHSNFNIKTGEGNVLFHHGDATGSSLPYELENLNIFFQSQLKKFDYIVFIPGNNDSIFESNIKKAKSFFDNDRIYILINEYITLCHINIYGTPFSLKHKNGAFMKSQSSIQEEWEKINQKTEILISHGPPFGILDYIPNTGNVGCYNLRKVNEKLTNLKLHGFGHIHESNGLTIKDGITYLNASTSGDKLVSRNAWVLEWIDKTIIKSKRL